MTKPAEAVTLTILCAANGLIRREALTFEKRKIVSVGAGQTVLQMVRAEHAPLVLKDRAVAWGSSADHT